VIDWVFYLENVLRTINIFFNHFDQIYVSEFWENNFKIKIKKNENKAITIGSLFALVEEQKQHNFITEYGISQTSMEQIFNSFAKEGHERTVSVDIPITRELLLKLGIS
jgi:hypothetical protein